LLVAAGWWVFRAPLLEKPVAKAPDVDLDPPALRARREAAIALALMPDDPWTLAEALAPSAPAQAPAKEDCGLEDAAQFSKPDGSGDPQVQVAGPSLRFVTAEARIDAALRTSADPLDRAVADLVNVDGMRTEAGSDEAVVQQAAVTTDPRLYALGYGLCHGGRAPAPSCSAMTLERWTQVDPGNGTPWIESLNRAYAQGDAAGVEAALARLAAATRFDAYVPAAAGAIASRVAPDERDLGAAGELAIRAIGIAAALPAPTFQPLIQLCRDQAGGDERRAQSCRTISDVMFEHTDNLLTQSISGVLLQQTTGDASRREFIRAERAVLYAQWSPATGFSECGEMRDLLKRALRTAQVGEVEAMRERARRFVPP
jgi:hypothetical protein